GHGLSHLVFERAGSGPESQIQIIAEIKKASPSRGVFVEALEPVTIARAYTEAGAVGISVVTEENYFRGSIEWMREVRLMVEREYGDRRPSILRKDFVVDSYQL